MDEDSNAHATSQSFVFCFRWVEVAIPRFGVDEWLIRRLVFWCVDRFWLAAAPFQKDRQGERCDPLAHDSVDI